MKTGTHMLLLSLPEGITNMLVTTFVKKKNDCSWRWRDGRERRKLRTGFLLLGRRQFCRSTFKLKGQQKINHDSTLYLVQCSIAFAGMIWAVLCYINTALLITRDWFSLFAYGLGIIAEHGRNQQSVDGGLVAITPPSPSIWGRHWEWKQLQTEHFATPPHYFKWLASLVHPKHSGGSCRIPGLCSI